MSSKAPDRPDDEDFQDTTPEFPDINPDFVDNVTTFGEGPSYIDNIQDVRWHRSRILSITQPQKSLDEHWETLRQHFPRIHEMLRMTWGSQEAHNKMARLLWADTDDRSGFPKEVVFALIAIQAAHGREFGFEQTVETEKNIRDRW